MDNTVYHVLLGDRKVGPYDRRTIIGMRVKKALTSEHQLLAADGMQLTVAQLLHPAAPGAGVAPAVPERSFEPSRGGSYSVIQAVHTGTLVEVEGAGYAIPAFQGDLEVRVQTKVLRVAGRFREGRGWKEDRIKLPLSDIAHARLRGTVVDLWVRPPDGGGLQRVTLDLRTREAAGELAESLPLAAPWPGSEPLAGRARKSEGSAHPLLWAAVVGTALAVGGILAWVLTHRA